MIRVDFVELTRVADTLAFATQGFLLQSGSGGLVDEGILPLRSHGWEVGPRLPGRALSVPTPYTRWLHACPQSLSSCRSPAGSALPHHCGLPTTHLPSKFSTATLGSW